MRYCRASQNVLTVSRKFELNAGPIAPGESEITPRGLINDESNNRLSTFNQGAYESDPAIPYYQDKILFYSRLGALIVLTDRTSFLLIAHNSDMRIGKIKDQGSLEWYGLGPRVKFSTSVTSEAEY